MALSLDSSQQHVVTRAPNRSVLIRGPAGFGKTTAALHRLAAIDPERALVLVPGTGLVDKCVAMCRRLRVEPHVEALDSWLGRQARRAFGRLPDRDSEHATAPVVRFKRHRAVRVALEEIAFASDEPVGRADLHELWGDTGLLDEIVDASAGQLVRSDAEHVSRHASVQFHEIEVDEEGRPLLGVGGLPVNDGTPLHDAGTSDVEDWPVLFELERLRGGRRRTARYDHIVLDEAQELAPLELALLGRALRRGGALTVVGDEGQQLDGSAWFEGWDRTLTDLGAAGAERVELRESHRCPQAIVRLAEAVRDQLHVVPGPGVRLARHASDSDELSSLVAALREHAAPRVAIVTVDDEAARRLHRRLPADLGARLILDGDASWPRGVVVAPVSRLRGLEVEVVAVPGLSGHSWPETGASRRALYVAVTRASQEVWLSAAGPWSPILKAA